MISQDKDCFISLRYKTLSVREVALRFGWCFHFFSVAHITLESTRLSLTISCPKWVSLPEAEHFTPCSLSLLLYRFVSLWIGCRPDYTLSLWVLVFLKATPCICLPGAFAHVHADISEHMGIWQPYNMVLKTNSMGVISQSINQQLIVIISHRLSTTCRTAGF